VDTEISRRWLGSYFERDWAEEAESLKSLLSNSTIIRGTLYPTYNEPFDKLAIGPECQSMRGLQDACRNCLCENEAGSLHLPITRCPVTGAFPIA